MPTRKVLLVTNSILYRKIINSAMEEIDSGLFVISENSDSKVLDRLDKESFEIIIIDLNLQNGNAIEMIDVCLSKYSETPVIILSNQNAKSKANREKAMDKGVFHCIYKELDEGYDSNLKNIKRELRVVFSKLKAKARLTNAYSSQKGILPSKKYSLLLIASSTGGPSSLESVITQLPKEFPVPILIVQHMPSKFTKNLANTLDRKSGISVLEAKEGDQLTIGTAFIAPGGFHIEVDKSKKILLNESDYVNGVRPSADVLFASVAYAYRDEKILTVILTGMGSDGTEGVRALKNKCDCRCITQSEKTCIVYGMPRSVVEAGLSDEVLDLKDIAQALRKITVSI